MKKIVIFILQLATLFAFNEVGYIVASYLPIQIPGNVVGLLLLFACLMTGMIKVEWVDVAGGFLSKHLAFFFIPIAVGIMAYKDVLLSQGLAFALALIGSLIVGLLVTGHVTQYFTRKKEVEQHERSIAQ